MNRKQRRAAKKQSQHIPAGGSDLFSQGVALHQQGQLDEAAALYCRLLKSNPKHAEGWYHLGGIAYQKGLWPETIEHLEKAIALKSDYAEAHNVIGVALKNSGQLEKAFSHLSQAITLQSNFPDAYCNLGNVLMQMERYEEAEKQYCQAISLKPGFVLALSNLGATLLRLRRWEEAITNLKQAIALAPTYAEAQNNLGVAYKELGQAEQSLVHYEKALSLNPQYGDAHNNLGNALVTLERHNDAIEHFQKAIELGLNNAEVITNLGAALQELERYDDALSCYRQAIELKPNYAVAYNNMGNTLNLQGKPDEAIGLYEQAIERDPLYAESYNNIGVVLSEQGHIEEALECFQNTIERDPDNIKAHHYFSSLHKFTPDDRYGEALLQQAQRMDSLTDAEKYHLNYALGKYHQDIGEYDIAFKYFNTGAAQKRRTLNYDITLTENALKGVEQFFEPGDWAQATNYGYSSDLPVFILGMPRSGTTLVEQILAAHPDVYGAGELKEFDNALHGFKANSNLWTPTSNEATNLAKRGKQYVETLAKLAPEAARITDKMPFNFMSVGLIHLALPNAIIIHCKRDPVDTCLSNFFTYFAEPIEWSYDLDEIGRFYCAYAELMEHWHRVLPGRVLDVRYEDVVADLDGQARRIIDHCGLPWDDACLEFQKAKRTVRTASSGQVRKPIYTTSVQRWRRYEAHLDPLLDALAPVLTNPKAA